MRHETQAKWPSHPLGQALGHRGHQVGSSQYVTDRHIVWDPELHVTANSAAFDQLIDDLAAGRLDGEIPPHGTLARVRQQIPADKAAGVASPDAPVQPAWMPAPEAAK